MCDLKFKFASTLSLLALSLVSTSHLAWGEDMSLKNWGLVPSLSKSDIQAQEAWRIQEGNRKIVVAIIDTGMDSSHHALKANLWHDPKSPDKEAFGWDFVTNTPNPVDQHGHGTHIAGIIGAEASPVTGVSGVAHRVSIMSVKYYSESNSGAVNLDNTVRAIHYALDHGARIINYSGGGPEFSEKERLAIKRAESMGVLFVAAAGNEHQNIDQQENKYYPSSYHLSNIISVAATDIRNNLLLSSNWGAKSVDVAAPGDNIFSTLPKDSSKRDRFGYMSGTSQATAFVSGIAALLLAQDPSLTPQDIRKIIMGSVDPLPQLRGKVESNGRINAYSALLALKSRNGRPAPQTVQNLVAHF